MCAEETGVHGCNRVPKEIITKQPAHVLVLLGKKLRKRGRRQEVLRRLREPSMCQSWRQPGDSDHTLQPLSLFLHWLTKEKDLRSESQRFRRLTSCLPGNVDGLILSPIFVSIQAFLPLENKQANSSLWRWCRNLPIKSAWEPFASCGKIYMCPSAL